MTFEINCALVWSFQVVPEQPRFTINLAPAPPPWLLLDIHPCSEQQKIKFLHGGKLLSYVYLQTVQT